MGGVKKKSLASMEKTQDSQDAGQEETKGKKAKEPKGGPQLKRQLAFLPPRMTEAEMVKSLTPLRAITITTASRALGVNASVANAVLKDLEAKQLLVRAGGFSGHGVWAVKS